MTNHDYRHDYRRPWPRWLRDVIRANMNPPQPPENARIVRRDGTVVPLELTFWGYDKCGCAIWITPLPYLFEPAAGDQLRVAILPAKTGIRIIARNDDADD